MAELPCPMWGTPATESREADGDKVYVFSHRAGGLYTITGSAARTVKNLSTEDKFRLTTWTCDQRKAGVTDPVITSDIIEQTKGKLLLTTSERVDRGLLFFDGMRLGDTLIFFPGGFSKADPQGAAFAAMTECETADDIEALCALMEEMGLLRDVDQVIGRFQFTPTANGWLRIEALKTVRRASNQAFVAMWFNDSVAASYQDGIAPAIRDCGYEPLRIDQTEHADKIDDRIIAEIRRSRFVVADFTCPKGSVRGGVYYEAGFARGLELPVISTCRRESLDDVHFDTRQYNHLLWDDPASLRIALTARIGAVIGDGPKKQA